MLGVGRGWGVSEKSWGGVEVKMSKCIYKILKKLTKYYIFLKPSVIDSQIIEATQTFTAWLDEVWPRCVCNEQYSARDRMESGLGRGSVRSGVNMKS